MEFHEVWGWVNHFVWHLIAPRIIIFNVKNKLIPMRSRRKKEGEHAVAGKEAWEYARIAEKYMKETHEGLALSALSFANIKEGTIVDLGAGPGGLAIEIAKLSPKTKVIGIDVSKDMVQIGTKRKIDADLNNLEFRQGDAANLPFPEGYVDLIVSHGSLHHWDDPIKVFNEVHRVLKSSGTIFITDLRRDAPKGLIKSRISQINHMLGQPEGFINSINAAYTLMEIKNIITKTKFEDFGVFVRKESRIHLCILAKK